MTDHEVNLATEALQDRVDEAYGPTEPYVSTWRDVVACAYFGLTGGVVFYAAAAASGAI